MKEININHIDIDLDGDGIPEKYILKDKTLNALFQTLANIAFSSDYNDLINQPTSLPASDVYEWAKNIAKPEYTKNEIGLENVDNTSDLNKPVSIAQQKAIDDAYANSNGYTDQKISELINGAPTSLDTLGELAKAMTDNADVVSALEQAIGSKANQNEFDSHVGNDTIHITSSERNKWNSAISGTDDTKDNIVSFTSNDTTNPISWSDVSALTSGEKHTSIFTKISTMFKNIRYLYKLIGTTDISAIGNGTVTGGLSALNSNFINCLKKSDVVNNLTTTTTNVPLSASQGKVLNDKLSNLISNSIYTTTQKKSTGSDGTINTGLRVSARILLGAYDNNNGAYILIPFIYLGVWYLKAVSSGNLQSIQNVEISYSLILKDINS